VRYGCTSPEGAPECLWEHEKETDSLKGNCLHKHRAERNFEGKGIEHTRLQGGRAQYRCKARGMDAAPNSGLPETSDVNRILVTATVGDSPKKADGNNEPPKQQKMEMSRTIAKGNIAACDG